MKKLVVLNPLIEKLLSPEDMAILKEKLIKYFGADFVKDASPGIERVKELYKKYVIEVSEPPKPIIDSRCPAITHFMMQKYKHLKSFLAPVNPILITGAEIRRKEIRGNTKLIVIAPCYAFEVYNNPKAYRTIVTWEKVKLYLNFHPPQKDLSESPVPPGFFNYLEEMKIYSASGKKECEELLSNIPSDADLLELLYCPGGCHRGDGL